MLYLYNIILYSKIYIYIIIEYLYNNINIINYYKICLIIILE
jgi:hypothetical protein